MLSSVTRTLNQAAVSTGNTLFLADTEKVSQISTATPIAVLHKGYIATEDKKIQKYTEAGLVAVGTAVKRPTKLKLCREAGDEALYIADRAGSVYRIVPAKDTEPALLFGSISMITDMHILEKHVITVDKDSKIRITDKVHPHRIDRFVLAHSKPLLSTTVIDAQYIVSGGYDSYLSVYDTATNKTFIYDFAQKSMAPFSLETIPGLQTPSKVVNINTGGKCWVKKILADRTRLFVITETTPLIIAITRTKEGMFLVPTDLPKDLDGLSVADGEELEEGSGFLFITPKGKLYQFDKILEEISVIDTYLATDDTDIVSKYIS
ncbi:hypothetical protein NEDG_00595 [Nematocida displodere]|uniref:Uncharacterized protein n=1 Tax=Nematocida displodere TaxID=1805483 RepID=A0A177EE90_9MICR|nr:hypothetical protein NEDG_00595 [Nematocida displodere]